MSDVPLKASDNSDESLGLTSAKVNHLVAEKNDNLPESNRKLRSHTTPLSEESRVSALATKSPRFVGLDTDIIEARAAEVPSETRDDGHSVMDGPSSQLLNQGGNGGNELPSHGGSDVVGNQNGGAPSMESVAQPHHPTGENNKKERTSVPPQLRQLDTQNPTPRKKRGITPMDPTPASDRTPRRTHVHITVNDLAATVTSNTIHNSDDSMDSKPLMREMDFLKECILDLEQSSKNIAEKEGLGDKELTLKSPRPHITRSIQTIKEVLSLSARIHEEMISLNSREKQLAESEASLKDERNVFENEKNSTDFVTLKTEMERVQAQNVEILGLLNKFLEKQTDSEAHGAKRHAEDAFGDEELPDKDVGRSVKKEKSTSARASGSRTPSNGKKGLRSHPASYYGLEADGHPIPANGEPPLPQSSVKTKGRLLSNQLKRLGVDSPVVRTALSKNDTAGRPVSYAGEIYKYSEINNCSPEVLEVVHYLNDKLHSWWTRNSEANSAGTRLCAHTHIIGRKGPTSQNDWNHGPDFACGKCTSAHRPCIHAAVIDDNMVLVVKPFFSG